MEHIQIEKFRILKLAEDLKKEVPNHEIYLKIDNRNKKIYLKLKDKLNFEEIKKIEKITKIYFEDYFLKILVG